MTLTRLKLDHFTAFDGLDIALGPGVNVFIGANGTGKTHLMKVAYSACDITKSRSGFGDKLVRTFLPSQRALGRLVKRQQGSSSATVSVWRGDLHIELSFSNHIKDPNHPKVWTEGAEPWMAEQVESAFIPVKEMLSHGPGFRALYNLREIHFEEVYADILDRAYRPLLRGPMDKDRKKILATLQKAIEGKVWVQGEEFFLQNKHGNLEFTLLAEGMRKLGLVWLLVQNGTLLNGSVLFWDEPEANLNPKLFGVLMNILLQLQRLGVQVILTTHDYAILKELELAASPTDKVAYYALYRPNPEASVACERAVQPFELEHSPIAEAFDSLYNRELRRALAPE